MYSGGSRLQYDTYYDRGDGPNDSDYNKKCPVDHWVHISGKCGNNYWVNREWKQAYLCGLVNGYDGNKVAWKALEDIEHYTKNLKDITCVASLIYYRYGFDNCLNLVLTWWVIYLSGQHGNLDYNGQRDYAANAIKQHVSSFDGKKHCPQYY